MRRTAIAVLVTVVVAALAIPASGAPEPRVVDLQLRTANLIFRIQGFGESETDTASRVQITLAADVLFRFNSAALSGAAKRILAGVATEIGQKARPPVLIDGYTDSKGSAAYNIGLSQRRARAVQSALSSTGVAFIVRGHGEADPVAPNTNKNGSDNSRGRAKNRRVTVRFSKR
jgi:outer membrane protein OmpA-like peptidoglycan-associated protein